MICLLAPQRSAERRTSPKPGLVGEIGGHQTITQQRDSCREEPGQESRGQAGLPEEGTLQLDVSLSSGRTTNLVWASAWVHLATVRAQI